MLVAPTFQLALVTLSTILAMRKLEGLMWRLFGGLASI